MSSYVHPAEPAQKLGPGFAGAVVLHTAVAAALIAFAFLHPSNRKPWGGETSAVGAIQASMVAAIPLPSKVQPVDKSVLAEEKPTVAPEPPPKEKTAPPPDKNDLLIKNKVDTRTPPKTAPKVADVPKHPQPTPDTPKAATGPAATQIAQSVTQAKNGTAAATVEDKAFGTRYAYYRDIVSRTVAQNWYTAEADPRSSQGKHVVVVIEIQRDGSIASMKIQDRSGSASLDSSALHALQRIEGFGPLPAGDHVTVELSFDYHQP